MSGGFFRGTSADQDTRFSNKQAKLLKSQKFAPELETLVDITKVKMDVIRPWIATKATELLGFEDEVLINFIYGLLDGKGVNGKEVQIQLTGFMEKNTGKFMKELWTLLLSAQDNISGVPQQFLDAKEEETRKKKEETDRIAGEIQKKREKESREIDQERSRKMDGNGDMKSGGAELVPSSRRQSKFSHPDDERDAEQTNGVQRRKRASRSPPRSADRALSPPRRSRSRSLSKSPNSRSDAESRSPSRSPRFRRGSISRSPRRSRSPVQRRFRSYRRGSISRSPRRSRSPIRRRFRSPLRRRSPYPARRSPSPSRYPSPRRRRSPSPIRRRRSRSPPRRRESPPPYRRRRSPLPMRRRSPPPMRRRSPSIRQRRQRSPSTPRRHSPSPVKHRPLAASRQRSLSPPRRRSMSRSLSHSSSPPSARRGSPSPVKRISVRGRGRSPSESPRGRDSLKGRSSPMARRPPSMRSGHRDTRNGEGLHNRGSVLSSSPEKSPARSKSPAKMRKTVASEDESSHGSPPRQRREQIAHESPERNPRKIAHLDSPESRKEDEVNKARDDANKPRSSRGRTMHSPDVSRLNDSPSKLRSSERLTSNRATEPQNHSDIIEPRRKYPENKMREVLPGTADQRSSPLSDERVRTRQNEPRDSDQARKTETVAMSVEKVDLSEEKDKHRSKHKEKRKHKRSPTSDDEYSSGSEIEDRKEAKRRKKEEKRRLRKEEKHKRREERHRKKEERRLEKRKLKNQDDSNASDGEHISKKGSHSSSDEEAFPDPKKLEIELREKALESLKAKKGVSN